MRNVRNTILNLSNEVSRFTTRDVLAVFSEEERPSRQYVSKIISELLTEGGLVKGGSTRGAFYAHPGNQSLATAMTKVVLKLKNDSLKEHEALEDIRQRALFFPRLKRNIQDIFNYSFSEMLNNAIDHSDSKNIEVVMYKDKENLHFEVNDLGIGVFKSIMTKKGLDSELSAIQDLLKGKTTTMPQAHSGEGIFFTSKMADLFILESYDYRLRIDNTIPDIFVEPVKPIKRGTRVKFSIRLNSKRHAIDVFQKYVSNPDTLAFDKTDVQIRLYTMGTIHVSRSQARRVLSGLDKFKTITLDFDKVPTVGQGFADEIFRVFRSRHPGVQITAINTNEAVRFMIDRVEEPSYTLNVGS